MKFRAESIFEPRGITILTLFLTIVFFLLILLFRPQKGSLTSEVPMQESHVKKEPQVVQTPPRVVPQPSEPQMPVATPETSKPEQSHVVRQAPKRPVQRPSHVLGGSPVPQPVREIEEGKEIPDFHQYGRQDTDPDTD
jgi:hypothetical protein